MFRKCLSVIGRGLISVARIVGKGVLMIGKSVGKLTKKGVKKLNNKVAKEVEKERALQTQYKLSANDVTLTPVKSDVKDTKKMELF